MLSEIEYVSDLKSSKCFYFHDLNFLLPLMWPEIVFTFFFLSSNFIILLPFMEFVANDNCQDSLPFRHDLLPGSVSQSDFMKLTSIWLDM